jgi:hypothetical protein
MGGGRRGRKRKEEHPYFYVGLLGMLGLKEEEEEGREEGGEGRVLTPLSDSNRRPGRRSRKQRNLDIEGQNDRRNRW